MDAPTQVTLFFVVVGSIFFIGYAWVFFSWLNEKELREKEDEELKTCSPERREEIFNRRVVAAIERKR